MYASEPPAIASHRDSLVFLAASRCDRLSDHRSVAHGGSPSDLLMPWVAARRTEHSWTGNLALITSQLTLRLGAEISPKQNAHVVVRNIAVTGRADGRLRDATAFREHKRAEREEPNSGAGCFIDPNLVPGSALVSLRRGASWKGFRQATNQSKTTRP